MFSNTDPDKFREAVEMQLLFNARQWRDYWQAQVDKLEAQNNLNESKERIDG